MYMAGIAVKWKDNGSDQDMHQKSVVLHGSDMTIFGSSNWTASSSDSQREHNYFTLKPWFVEWFTEQFLTQVEQHARRRNAPSPRRSTSTSRPAFRKRLSTSRPRTPRSASGPSVTLKWEGGWWAHKYDIYFGTTNPPPLIAQDFMPGSATAGAQFEQGIVQPVRAAGATRVRVPCRPRPRHDLLLEDSRQDDDWRRRRSVQCSGSSHRRTDVEFYDVGRCSPAAAPAAPATSTTNGTQPSAR